MANGTKSAKRAFYIPHKRVSYDGAHPDTGEVMPSMTKQAHKAECDINNIIKQFSVTGQIKHMSANQGMYTDLPEGLDFQQAQQIVIDAEKAFMSLPANVRDRFHNEPVEFLEFMEDPANKDEAIRLGLVTAPPPPAEPIPDKEPVPPAPPAPAPDPKP